MKRERCTDQHQGRRCTSEANHSGVHSDGEWFWRFDDGLPEWRKRMNRIGLPAKDMTNAGAPL